MNHISATNPTVATPMRLEPRRFAPEASPASTRKVAVIPRKLPLTVEPGIADAASVQVHEGAEGAFRIDWEAVDRQLQRPERLLALRSSKLLDAPPDAYFDRLAEGLKTLINVPIVLVSLVDDRRQFFASCVGLPTDVDRARETPLNQSLCKLVAIGDEQLLIEDTRAHGDFKAHKATTELGVVAYAGVPIRDAAGNTLGSLCAIDTEPHRWDDAAVQTLERFSTAITAELQLRQLAAPTRH